MESLCGCKIPDGHPLFVLYKENDAISKKLAGLRDKIVFDESDDFKEAMDAVLQVSSHYEKKTFLYPLVGEVSLAADMTAEDDRIMDELSFLNGDESMPQDLWDERLLALLTSMRDMISRENNFLYPHLSQTLTEEQWIQVYFAFKNIKPCHMGAYPLWMRAEHPDAPRCACEL